MTSHSIYDQLLVEYSCMREEIRAAAARRMTTLAFSATLWIAAVGTVLSIDRFTDQGWGRLVALGLLHLPLLLMTVGNQMSDFDMAKSAAYLRRFIEPGLDAMQYERRAAEAGFVGRFGLSAIIQAVALALAVVSWTVSVSAGTRPRDEVLYGLIALEGLAVAALLWTIWAKGPGRTLDHRGRCMAKWDEVAHDEVSHG